MKKWKPLILHIQYESGPEQLIRQDSGYVSDFELHQRDANINPYWTRVYNKTSTIRWQDFYADTRMFYDNSNTTVTFSNPGIFTLGDSIQPRRSAQIVDEARSFLGGLEVTEVNTRGRTITVSNSTPEPVLRPTLRVQLRTDHVRSHQEAINQMAAAQAQMMADRSEMQRRAEQRRAEQQRIEQERTRERRPWERVRNFFGRD
jgi:hypothetical protein